MNPKPSPSVAPSAVPRLARLLALILTTFAISEPANAGQIDPSFVITHTVGLDDGPEMYKVFRDKQDSCIKVVLKP